MGYFSFRTNRCGLCRRSFVDKSSLNQHVRDAHRFLRWKAGIPTVLLAGIAVLLYYRACLAKALPIDPADFEGARVGDHWHAPYVVMVCGKALSPLRPTRYPPQNADVVRFVIRAKAEAETSRWCLGCGDAAATEKRAHMKRRSPSSPS